MTNTTAPFTLIIYAHHMLHSSSPSHRRLMLVVLKRRGEDKRDHYH